jgi:hypothetical protein
MKNIYIITLFVLLLAGGNTAQTWDWAKGANPLANGEGYGTATDSYGNVYICGFVNGMNNVFPGVNFIAGRKIYLAKYDASGAQVWVRTQDNNNNLCFAYWVHTDGSGNVFVTGTYSNQIVFSTYTLTSTGNYDTYIVKFDGSGNVLWAKSGGGAQYDAIFSGSSDAAGNSYVTGYSSSTVCVFGTTALNFNSINHGFLVKYDPMGNVIWSTSGITTGNELGNSVNCDQLGNVFMTGYFSTPSISFGSNTLVCSGLQDLYLVKYDSGGNALWAVSSTGNSSEYGHSVSTNSIGDVYLGGYYTGTLVTIGAQTFTNASNGNAGGFVAKFAGSGAPMWAVHIDGGSPVWCVNAHQAGVFVVGSIQGSSLQIGNYTATVNPVVDDSFFASFDSNGGLIYATPLIAGGDDQISVANSGSCVAYLGGDYAVNQFALGATTLYVSGSIEIPFIGKLLMNTVPLISGNLKICPGVSATITASGSLSYVWNGLPGPNSIVVAPPVNTTYTVTGTGVCGTGSTAVTVSVDPLPVYSVTASSPSVCSGSSVALTAGGNATFNWSGGISNGVPFFPSSTSAYIVTATNSYNCTHTTAVTIPVAPTPTIPPVATSTAICPGNTTTLTATGASNYTWLPVGFNSSLIIVNPQASVNYTLIQANGNCIDTSMILIIVNPAPTLVFSPASPSICIGTWGKVKVSGAHIYQWLNGIDSVLNLMPAVTSIFTVTGTNTLTGCSTTSGVQVTVLSCVGIAELFGDETLLQIYPNPARDQVSVKIPGNRKARFIAQNSLGETVVSVDTETGQTTLHLSALARGIYLCFLVEDDCVRRSAKLCVE